MLRKTLRLLLCPPCGDETSYPQYNRTTLRELDTGTRLCTFKNVSLETFLEDFNFYYLCTFCLSVSVNAYTVHVFLFCYAHC